ncbi:5726_t:CDS:1, partial [Racocetra persica]
QEQSAAARHNTCKVLVSVEHVTMKGEDRNGIAPNRISYSHQLIDGTTRAASSADGQIFYLLDEVPTTVNYVGNNNARFYSGASYAGEIIVQP